MIVLDTNVLSEAMRQRPDPAVLKWLDEQKQANAFITSITVFEIEFGISRLADGKRKETLRQGFRSVLEEEFVRRVLPFGQAEAVRAGELGARLQMSGKTVEMRDLMIAAIVSVSGGKLATLNKRHFEDCGIELVNVGSY